MYTKTLSGLADVGFSSHMKNTATPDKAADVGQMFLAECVLRVEEDL